MKQIIATLCAIALYAFAVPAVLAVWALFVPVALVGCGIALLIVLAVIAWDWVWRKLT